MENLINQKKYFYLLYFISFCFLSSFIIFSFFSWNYGDDYLYKVAMKDISPIKFIMDLYLTHDGRHLSPFGIIQMYIIKYFDAFGGILIYLLAYLIASWILFKKLISDLSVDKKIYKVYFLPFSFLLLFGLLPVYKDVLCWLTGGAYMLVLLQGFLLFTLLDYLLRINLNISNLKKIVYSIIILLLSLNSQNLMLIILFFSFIAFYKIYVFDKRISYKWILIVILPIILSMLITSLAPGNFSRISREESNLNLNFFKLLENFKMIYFRFFIYSKWVISFGLIVGLAISFYYKETVNYKPPRFYFEKILFFVFASILSMSPFILVPNIARIRVFFIGMVFLFIAFFYLGVYCSNLKLFKVKPVVINLLPLLSITTGVLFMTQQIKLVIPFSRQVEQRATFLESNRGSNDTIYYKKLLIPKELVLIRWADYKNYGDWDKVKEYYNLKYYIELE
jgi:hypothetical protein